MHHHLSALLTDQYELVMAAGYHQLNMAERPSVFHLFFRTPPIGCNYTICAGLERVIEYLTHWSFSQEDIDYLSTLKNPQGHALFKPDFLNYLNQLKFTCDIDAIPEGTIVFPQEPLLRIKGPLLQCQLLETALINFIQFASVVATHASSLCAAAEYDPIIEFGLRRAQGPDGGLTASRAAYLGGAAGTSNVLAGQQYGIPVYGTQAHSWIMAFPDEQTAFARYIDVMEENAVLLVDTYHTMQGVQHAIEIGHRLRQQGQELLAIRLDSGDLGELSRAARAALDAAGLTRTKIMASGDLNATCISTLKKQEAPIDIWGVGTKLATAAEHPYLNAVYKLAGIEDEQHTWQYKFKISDTKAKSTLPGIHQVRRYYNNQQMQQDVIYDLPTGLTNPTPQTSTHTEDLLQPIFRGGELVYQPPKLEAIRDRCLAQAKQYIKDHPDTYPVEIDAKIEALRGELT